MRNTLMLFFVVFAFGLISCAPTASQLKKIIEDNPDIVFVAIEKDPEQFIEVVNKAAREAQNKAQQKAMDEQKSKRDEEFSSPLKPEIDEKRAFKGPKDAPITIVEYSEFECPYCARGYSTVNEVFEKYKGQVRLLFKHLPLDFHPKAMPAAKMFEAIAIQSAEKAYLFHDKVFESQDKLRSEGEKWMKSIAKNLGVDIKKMEKDMESKQVKDIIEKDISEAKKFGITGTPGYVINGVSIKGAYPISEFSKIIDRHLGQSE